MSPKGGTKKEEKAQMTSPGPRMESGKTRSEEQGHRHCWDRLEASRAVPYWLTYQTNNLMKKCYVWLGCGCIFILTA